MTKTELLEKELRHQDNISIGKTIHALERLKESFVRANKHNEVIDCNTRITQLWSRIRTEK